jgi:hypothetical protein
MTPDYVLQLVRVTGPDFVASFEVDERAVREAAPILKALIGMSVDQARDHIRAKGWTASMTQPEPPRIVQHVESFEVRKNGQRAFFYFDEIEGRRAITGRTTKQKALERAQAYLTG